MSAKRIRAMLKHYRTSKDLVHVSVKQCTLEDIITGSYIHVIYWVITVIKFTPHLHLHLHYIHNKELVSHSLIYQGDLQYLIYFQCFSRQCYMKVYVIQLQLLPNFALHLLRWTLTKSKLLKFLSTLVACKSHIRPDIEPYQQGSGGKTNRIDRVPYCKSLMSTF